MQNYIYINLKFIEFLYCRSILLELMSSDAPPDPRWTHQASHSDPDIAVHKHHSHPRKSSWEGSAPTVHTRVSVDLMAMAVDTVLSASLERALVLCEMHVHPSTLENNHSVAGTETPLLHQTHLMGGKVSADANGLLLELIDAHSEALRATDDDDERLNNLNKSISRY